MVRGPELPALGLRVPRQRLGLGGVTFGSEARVGSQDLNSEYWFGGSWVDIRGQALGLRSEFETLSSEYESGKT